MGRSESAALDGKTPVAIALALVAIGVLIAASSGLTQGSILGGAIAASGAIPSCLGMWKGIQQETQTTLAMSIIAVVVSLAVGAVLIVLGLIHLVS